MNAIRKETKIALLEQNDKHIYDYLDRFDKRFDKLESTLNNLYSKIDSNNKWLIGLAISVFFSAGTLALSVYQFFH